MALQLRDIVERKGDEVAVIDEFGSWTYREHDARINQTIHGLRSLGMRPQETVCLLSGNRSEFCTTWTAALHAQWQVVPVNWHFSADEVAYILEDSGARALVADAEYADLAAEAAQSAGTELRIGFGGPIEGFVDLDELLGSSPAAEPEDQSDGRFMLYTSGTTGHPKGVIGSTAVFGGDPLASLATVTGFLEMLGIGDPDGVSLVNAPLYHGGPLGFSFAPASLGSRVVLRRKWDAVETLRLIDEHQVTNVYAVPTHFVRLLALPEEVRSSFDGSSLRTVFHTAAPCPPEVKRRMIEWWGPVINEIYGASEGGFAMCTKVGSEEWLERPGTVGRASPISEVYITDEAGELLGPDEVGTVYLRSLLGIDFEYHGAPEKTAAAHHERGGYTAGDVGYLDEDGYLFLSDRMIDMIISGGVNIYPAEIEACLIEHPAVADVAVIGVPDDEYGEEVKALVQLVDDVDPSDDLVAELRDHCRRGLAGFMVPRTVDFMTLPRTPTGKLAKRTLREPYWRGTGRSI